jgi:hypothetical protein
VATSLSGVDESILGTSYESFRKEGATGIAAIVKDSEIRDVGVLDVIGIPCVKVQAVLDDERSDVDNWTQKQQTITSGNIALQRKEVTK